MRRPRPPYSFSGSLPSCCQHCAKRLGKGLPTDQLRLGRALRVVVPARRHNPRARRVWVPHRPRRTPDVRRRVLERRRTNLTTTALKCDSD